MNLDQLQSAPSAPAPIPSQRLLPGRRLWVLRAVTVLAALLVGVAIGTIVWSLFRRFGPTPADRAAAAFEDSMRSLPVSSRELLEVGGYGPTERLVLQANFDSALVFSGRVFDRDAKRGYRFCPSQENLWVFPEGLTYQVLVPASDSVQEALDRTGGRATSRERINSLGCRGPEPRDFDSYDFRVLVLGDSFVEGLLVDEADTFCARLEARLDAATGRSTLVVNSGVIGYSTEQEIETLEELAPIVRPHAAVLCFYANDVHHDHYAVLDKHAAGDWSAARRGLNRFASYCRAENILHFVAVIPDRSQMADRASRQHYQLRLDAICADIGIALVDPDERFFARRRERLWLERDAHFAPAGHSLFADVLAEHLESWAKNARPSRRESK